jgi:hypothetical protein
MARKRRAPVRVHRDQTKEPSTEAAGQATVIEPDEDHGTVNGKGRGVTAEAKAKATQPKIPFWELVASLGDKWATDDYKLYVYRKWPIIDKGDSDHFLAKLREPIDPDYLLKTFGSGKYGLQLNDGQGKMVSYKVESVNHPDYPPKLNPAEVTRDPQNDKYWVVWANPIRLTKRQPRRVM